MVVNTIFNKENFTEEAKREFIDPDEWKSVRKEILSKKGNKFVCNRCGLDFEPKIK